MKKSLLLVALIHSSLSFASGTGPGMLSLVHTINNGVVVFYTNAARTGTVPGCAASTSSGGQNRFAFDSTTPAGKTMFAGLLAAYYAGKQVNIGGTGTCDTQQSDTETAQVILTSD